MFVALENCTVAGETPPRPSLSIDRLSPLQKPATKRFVCAQQASEQAKGGGARTRVARRRRERHEDAPPARADRRRAREHHLREAAQHELADLNRLLDAM